MSEGTIIPKQLKATEFDDNVMPILEKRRKSTDKFQDLDSEELTLPPERGYDLNGQIFSAILATIIGYLIFSNEYIIKIYSSLIKDFYDEDKKMTLKGTLLQCGLFMVILMVMSYWLL